MKEIFVKFKCPSFTDEEFVLKDIQRLLAGFKCEMLLCGNMEDIEHMLFRKATGACSGKPIPPKYRKIVTDD